MKKGNHKKEFLCAAILMIIYAAIEVLFAIILKYIIDSVSTGDKTRFFQFLVLGIVDIGAEFLFANLSRYYTLKYVRINLEDSKDQFYWHLLNKEDSNKIDRNEADLSMFSTNVDILYGNYYVNKPLIVNYVAKFVLAILAVIYLNWIVFFVAFFTSLVPLVIPQLFKKIVQKSVDDYSSSSKGYLDFISDSINGVDEIRSYNNQQIFFEKQSNVNSILEYTRFKSKMVVYFVNMLSSNLSSLTFLATIGVSGYFAINGEMSIGTMMAIIQLLNSIVTPLVNISSSVNEINSVKNVVNQYNTKFIEEGCRNSSIDFFERDIVIQQLSYSYDDNNHIINNFSYVFKKNKKYAIVGESGSGKSTLAKIISGNIKGYSGQILIDGIDLSTINLQSYRKLCRYISQQPYIFKDTIENNILFYSKERKSIDSVIRMFNLEELIKNVGINKIITDTDGISGGQKQRVVLSRAIFRESPILILDEPTASLDFKNTADVINELIKVEDLTLIMITHEHNEKLLNLFDEVITIN